VIASLFFISTYAGAQNKVRDKWQQPEKIMDAVGLKPGMRVGEAGAGAGYFTFKLAERVGAEGVVFANDIDTTALNKLRKEIKRRDINNIEIIEGHVENPLFPDTLDMVFMVYVFHHLDKPVTFFQNITRCLKDEAFVVLVERNPQKYSKSASHFWSDQQIRDKIDEIDYHIIQMETFPERDNIYIIRPNYYLFRNNDIRQYPAPQITH
jgi:ubiquinone/menaquinone biosynthesis C-methylase UbiE